MDALQNKIETSFRNFNWLYKRPSSCLFYHTTNGVVGVSTTPNLYKAPGQHSPRCSLSKFYISMGHVFIGV